MNKVYIVEFRMNHMFGNKEYIENLSIHVASSLEKALFFCKNSTRYHDHNRNTPWWFVISEEKIDNEDNDSSNIVSILDWNAEPITEQPIFGYYKPRLA